MFRSKMWLIGALTALSCFAMACDGNNAKGKATADGPEKEAKAEDGKEGKDGKDAAAMKKPDAPAESAPANASDSELPFEATGPVAVIGGKEVSAEVFNKEVERFARAMKGRVPPMMMASYKKRVLYKVVDSQIIQMTIDEQKLEVTDAEVEEELTRMKSSFPDPKMFDQFMAQTGQSMEEVRMDVKQQVGLKKILAKDGDIAVTDADVKKFYDDNPEKFEQPEQVKASHILIKVDAKASEDDIKGAEKKVKEIEAKAKAKGADFAALAKEFSEGPSKTNGGDLGFFTRRKMVKPFSDAAFKMKVGDISKPVRTQFGYHIIKVTEKKEAEKRAFDEVKDQIRSSIENKKLRESMNTFLTKAKKDKNVEFKEDNIKVNVQTPPPGMGGAGIPGLGGHGGHGHGHGHSHGDGHDHGAPGQKLKLTPPGAKAAPAPTPTPKK